MSFGLSGRLLGIVVGLGLASGMVALTVEAQPSWLVAAGAALTGIAGLLWSRGERRDAHGDSSTRGGARPADGEGSAELAKQRFAFVTETSELLASSSDVEVTLRTVARLVVPQLADWCTVALRRDGRLEPIAMAHADASKAQWAAELPRKGLAEASALFGASNAARTGRPVFLPRVDEAALEQLGCDDEQRRAVRALGITSLIAVPVSSRGDTLGALCLARQERPFASADLTLAQDLARRAGVWIDNVELHREAVRQREWVRTALSSIGDAVITTDAQGRVSFMNALAQTLTGWSLNSAAQLAIDEVFKIVEETTQEPIASPARRILADSSLAALSAIAVLVSRGGGELPIEANAAPIRDEAGKTHGVVMVFRDVTDKRVAAENLRESEQRFRLVSDYAPVMIWLADIDQRCSFFNKAWLDFTGRTMEQEFGYGWLDGVHPEDRERITQVFASAYKHRKPLSDDVRLRRHDGEYRWIMARGVPRFTASGSFAGYIGSCLDISDQKAAEHELRVAKEAAERANHAKDHFLAVLSHELRTPLNPIATAVQMLQEDTRIPEEARKYLGIIRRNVESETRLIDDLLDLNRISRDKLRLSFEATDVHAAVRAVVEMFRSEIATRGQRLTIALDAADARVKADPARLQQIFWNLLSNAVKFTPEGGSITVSSRNADARIIVTFNDTGIGMEPGTQTSLFNAFEQGGESITRRYGGLGLGLAVSKALVTAHGGTIRGESPGLGRGAVFAVELRLAQSGAPVAAPPAAAPSVKLQRSLRVLLVDDHEDTLGLMRLLLERRGHTVTPVNRVKEALDVAQREHFDLLISDIGLPDGSGLDLMRLLGGQQQLVGIAMSGFGRDVDIAKSKSAGFVEHLTKPVNIPALDQVIGRLFQ